MHEIFVFYQWWYPWRSDEIQGLPSIHSMGWGVCYCLKVSPYHRPWRTSQAQPPQQQRLHLQCHDSMGEWGITSEPLSILQLMPVTCAIYAKENDLLGQEDGNNSVRLKNMTRNCFEWLTKPSCTPTALPPSTNIAWLWSAHRFCSCWPDWWCLETQIWQEAAKLEWQSQDEYQTFEDWGYKTDPPKSYKKIYVHMVLMWNMMVHKACLTFQ